MTLVTRLAELTLMKVVVTIAARLVDGHKVTLRVTSAARHALMFTSEREAAHIMVKERDTPLGKARVASVTGPRLSLLRLTRRLRGLSLELTVMHIGVTERAGTLGVVFGLGPVGVTSKAGLIKMASPEVKPSDAVVETRLVPADG